jgi:tetratricopeptide (TPR) repeat protein
MPSTRERRRVDRQITPSREAGNGGRRVLAAAGLSAAALLAFANSFSAGFALDNKALILEDPRIRENTSENLHLILEHTYWWPHGEAGLSRPITTLSYLFNYAILGNGDHPAGYHWLNFLLHAGNVLLVYFLVSRLMPAFWPPVFAAGLWAVHPVLTESVTNIAGRADLIAAAAVLSGLLLYLKSVESAGWRRAALLAGLMAATAIGVFAKESAVVIPGLLALYEFAFWRQRHRIGGLLLGCAATLPPLAWMLLARAKVLAASPAASIPFTDNPIAGANFWTGRFTAIKVMAHCLGLTIWPANLSTDYSYPQIPIATGSLQDWLALAFMLAAAAVVCLLYRRSPNTFFFAGFAFLAFLPASNLLFPIGTIMAERLLYLPSVGLMACLGLAVYALPFGSATVSRRFAAPAILCLLAIAFTGRTWARNADWRDDITLARSAVEASPRSFKSHKILAAALLASGRDPATIDAVIDQASQSVALLDSLPDSWNDAAAYRLAGAAFLLKDNREADAKAIPLLRRAERIAGMDSPQGNPNDDAYRLLSLAYLRTGQTGQAVEQAAVARAREPLNPEVYRQVSSAFVAAGRPEEAAIALMEGVLLSSDQSLRSDLLALYRSGLDTGRCATMAGPNGESLNLACGIVHRHFCKAAAQAIEASLKIGRADMSESLRHGAGQLGCTSEE